MQKNYKFSELRSTSDLKELVDRARAKLNKETNAEISLSTFRRIALKKLAYTVLQGKREAIEILFNNTNTK